MIPINVVTSGQFRWSAIADVWSLLLRVSFSVVKSSFCLAYIEFIAIPATSFVDTESGSGCPCKESWIWCGVYKQLSNTVTVTFENVCCLAYEKFIIKMRLFTMCITAVCVLFLIKLRWPKSKSLYDKLFYLIGELLWRIQAIFYCNFHAAAWCVFQTLTSLCCHPFRCSVRLQIPLHILQYSIK